MADVPVNFTGKVRGWNLTSKPGHPLESDYWVEWDWTGWIQRQVDYAMALGANCIRLIGDVAMVQNSLITQNTYNTKLQQLVKYCVDNGLGYYYTGCATYGTDGSDNGTTAMTDAQIAAVINSNIGSVTGVSGAPDYSANIIGCDIIQEANALASASRINNIYSLVKPNVKSPIGCTFSTSQGLPPDSDTWINSIIASCDYLDYHIYPQVYGITAQPTPTDITNGPLTNHSSKQILFGEGGADTTAYTATQVRNWIVGLDTLGNIVNANIRGRLDWSIQDQQTSTQHYGGFDASWAARSDIAAYSIQGLSSLVPPTIAPPTRLRVVNSRLIWDPTGCSSGWTGTKLYRDGALLATLPACIYDDSANWSVQHRYQVTAVAGGLESNKSAVFYYPGAFGWVRK